MLRILIIIAILAAILFLTMPQKTQIQSITIGDVKLKVEVADRLLEQVQGLSFRDSLCATCGMLFIYKKPQLQNFWMRGMKFPLDIIFIRDSKVVEIFENVPTPEPGKEIPKVQGREEVDMVLEVNAGFAKKNNIKLGDRVSDKF